MTIFASCKQIMNMATVSLKTIEQNDNVSLFSICFEGSEESEFEKFMLKFKDNATYNKDYTTIILALAKIISSASAINSMISPEENSSSEKTSRNSEKIAY